MTEREYILVGNLNKISAALSLLSEVLPGGDYGISDQNLSSIINILRAHESDVLDAASKCLKTRPKKMMVKSKDI